MALTRITKGVIKPNENYDTHNIVSTGIVTSVGLDVNGNADISGSLSVGGVLTYEDVTSIDSVGIITARTGLVSPYADIDDFVSVGSNIHLGNAGVVTATSFVGSGAALTGIDATAIKDSGGNVKVQAQASGAMYTGIHTFSSGAEVGSNIKLGNAGVITATSFVGSGAALTGIDATAIKDSGGNVKIQAQASGAVYTGIHTFGTNTNFTDIDVDGHTNLDNLNIAGVSTFAGTLNASTVSTTALIASGDLDVDGHTNLDNVSIAGVSTFQAITGTTGTFSGTLTANNYLAIADQMYHVGDADTTVRFPAADTIALETAGSERLRIDSSGNIVTGDQTSPTSSDTGNIYIKNGSAIGAVSHQLNYVTNAAFNSAWKYITSSVGATRILVNQSGFQFDTAASGTAGNNITFSNRFNINNAGAIGVGGAYGSSGQVLTSAGSGSATTWSTITGTTINNNADNRIITGSGTANTLNGESGLLFDGTQLQVGGDSGMAGTWGLEVNNTHNNEGTALIAGLQGAQLQVRDLGSSECLKLAANGQASIQSLKGGDPMVFYTTPSGGSVTERLRITSGTSVEIGSGTGSDGCGLAIYGGTNNNVSGQDAVFYVRGDTASDWGMLLQKTTEYGFRMNTNSAATLSFAIYDQSNTLKHQFKGNGDYAAAGAVDSASDIKLKTNIKTIDNALDKVLQLRGAEYDRIDRDNQHEIGVIAQEVEKIIPEVVHGDETKTVSYGNIVAVLIEAIKEQNDVINKMKKEIEDLKG